MVAKASEIAGYKASRVLALTLRKYTLILDHTNSTGLKSDEYTSKKTTNTPFLYSGSKTPYTLCEDKLSNTKTPPTLNTGTKTCST